MPQQSIEVLICAQGTQLPFYRIRSGMDVKAASTWAEACICKSTNLPLEVAASAEVLEKLGARGAIVGAESTIPSAVCK